MWLDRTASLKSIDAMPKDICPKFQLLLRHVMKIKKKIIL